MSHLAEPPNHRTTEPPNQSGGVRYDRLLVIHCDRYVLFLMAVFRLRPE